MKPNPKSSVSVQSEGQQKPETLGWKNEGTILILTPYTQRSVIAQSVKRWATGWTIGVLGLDSWLGLGIFLFTTASRTALGPTQPPIQWVPGTISLGIKRREREAHNSPPTNAEVKNGESYTSTPLIRLHGVVLS
jgi:hypothetical protein